MKIHISHLVPDLENIPIYPETIKAWIQEAVDAKETKYFSVAGPYDMVVYPNGNFQLIPTRHAKTYRLCENKDFCEEVAT